MVRTYEIGIPLLEWSVFHGGRQCSPFRKLLLESRTRDPSWDVFEPRDEFHHKLPWDHGFGKCLHGGADSAYDLVVVIVDVDPINDLEQCRGEEAGNGAMIQTQVRACSYRGNEGELTA